MAHAEAELLHIQVVWGGEGVAVEVVELRLVPGATVADALQASALQQRASWAEPPWRLGIWGRACTAEQLLRDRDRVEVYRPLHVDPKEARRQRYRSHREKLRAEEPSGSRKR